MEITPIGPNTLTNTYGTTIAITPEKKRLAWLCENVSGFKAAYEAVQAVKQHEAENRAAMPAIAPPVDPMRATIDRDTARMIACSQYNGGRRLAHNPFAGF